MPSQAPAMLFAARPSARIGVAAGLLAGLAFLAAQIASATLLPHEDAWAPLRDIAALVIGSDAAWAGDESLASVALLALAIHLVLSAAYGRVVDLLVMNLEQRVVAALAGAVFGALLYVVNHCIVAPTLLPWLRPSRDLATALAHVGFGLVAALACRALRRRPG